MNSSTDDTPPDLARRLIDHLPSMLAYWDRDLRCRLANQAYRTWFGVDPAAMVGMHIRDLLGPELYALNEPYLLGALRGEQQLFERVVPGPHGERRHSLATYMPDIVDGQTVGIVVHVTEITRLKETEAALRSEIAQRERTLVALREAQRLGQIGSWEWNAETDTTTWSNELYLLFGHDPALPPPPYAQRARLYTPESWARLQALVEKSLKTGEPYTVELEVQRAGGEGQWVEARGEAVRADDGRVVGLRGTTLDVTPRRRMEEARFQLRLSEAASRNKTELLSRVSHELRTPLNGILGFADLCHRDATLSAKHREWAGLIGDSGRHMLDLVDEILDLATAEAGRLHLRIEDVNLADALAACLAHARAACDRAGLELLEPGSDALRMRVRADPRRLRQIIDNLLSNAVKYTPAPGRVSVAVERHADAVELRVADTGPGFAADQLAQVFTPFNRLGAERSRVPGRGLGLAVCKTIADAMGAGIRVESAPGQGSVFIVTLPLTAS
jgi:PAS domain S-box-containing protein